MSAELKTHNCLIDGAVVWHRWEDETVLVENTISGFTGLR